MTQVSGDRPIGWRFVVSTQGLGTTPSKLQVYLVYEDEKNKAVKLLELVAGLPNGYGIVGYRANLQDFIAKNMNPGHVKRVV